jgi:hypothetical protein
MNEASSKKFQLERHSPTRSGNASKPIGLAKQNTPAWWGIW